MDKLYTEGNRDSYSLDDISRYENVSGPAIIPVSGHLPVIDTFNHTLK